MAPLTRKLPELCLGLALQFFAVSAPAQQAAPAAPTVLQNSNSTAREDEAESVPDSEVESTGKVAAVPGAPVAVAPVGPVAVAPVGPVAIAPMVPIAVYPFMVRARTEGRRIEVRSSQDQAIARCVSGCWLNLPGGDYKAVFYDQSGAEHEFNFSVEGPGGIEIEDANPDTANTGLTFGILGTALVAGGLVAMVAAMQHTCLGEDECQDRDNPGPGLFVGGLVAMAAGAIMTPLGWVAFARNRHPRLHEIPTSVNVAMVPNRDGAFLGLTGQF